MHRLVITLAVCLVTTPAWAQDARVFVSAGASAQANTNSFTDVTTFPYFAETARTETTYDVGDGVAFDAGVTARLWRGFAVGIAVTRVSRDAEANTTGSFPHPFFFNRNRTGSWSAGTLDRTELGVHVSAAYQIVNQPSVVLTVFGGPSVFNFDHAVVDSVDVEETYPYDTIDAQVVTGSIDGSTVGYHAGFDVGWFFARNVGVGGLLRYASATKNDVSIGDGEPFDLELGGLQAGVGVRLRF